MIAWMLFKPQMAFSESKVPKHAHNCLVTWLLLATASNIGSLVGDLKMASDVENSRLSLDVDPKIYNKGRVYRAVLCSQFLICITVVSYYWHFRQNRSQKEADIPSGNTPPLSAIDSTTRMVSEPQETQRPKTMVFHQYGSAV